VAVVIAIIKPFLDRYINEELMAKLED